MSDAVNFSREPDATTTLTMSRKFPEPAQRLFDAWADPEQNCRWMGPKSVDCRVDVWDFREGGEYEIVMVSSEGNEFPAHGTFETIDPPNRLTMSWAWQHKDMMQGTETHLDLQFEQLDDHNSELRLTHSRMPDNEQAERHQEGWSGSFECLARHLAEKG